MSFFKQFPTQSYDFNRDGIIQQVVDIYRSVRVEGSSIDNPSLYLNYSIKDGERPDIVSQRLYNTPEYYWTFFVINEMLHDGMRAWPMSRSVMEDYLTEEYSGVAITTNPVTVTNTDLGITTFRDSLAGRFRLNETITGQANLHNNNPPSGTLVKKDIDLNQLVLKDVTGTFFGDPDLTSNSSEKISGNLSNDDVDTFRVYPYRDAPHHWHLITDPEKRPTDNSAYVSGGTSINDITYQSNQSFVFDLNEKRSSIRVISPQYIDRFVEDFETMINE
tara:strand:+ start:86 stop:913 length:828 start_codon:yes stop_codon:yes gene_type:complete